MKYFSTEYVRRVVFGGEKLVLPEKAMQEGWSTASAKIRAMGFGAGMGLPNMKKVSDEMQIATQVGKGTRVTLVFHLPA